MSLPGNDRAFIDGPGGKIVAGLVVLGCLIALIFLASGWHQQSTELAKPNKLNPKFITCRNERIEQFSKLRKDGSISQEQFNSFTQRAIAICDQQFQPAN